MLPAPADTTVRARAEDRLPRPIFIAVVGVLAFMLAVTAWRLFGPLL